MYRIRLVVLCREIKTDREFPVARWSQPVAILCIESAILRRACTLPQSGFKGRKPPALSSRLADAASRFPIRQTIACFLHAHAEELLLWVASLAAR